MKEKQQRTFSEIIRRYRIKTNTRQQGYQ